MSEHGLGAMTVGGMLEALASKTPAPGGGAAAAAAGALSAALAGMVVSYSAGKKSLAEHEETLRNAAAELARARGIMLELADEDAAAYGLVNELSKLPESDARRRELLPEATAASVRAPLATMAACVTLLRLFESLATRSNRHLRSDLAIAAILAEAAARSSAWNVAVNAGTLEGAAKDAALAESERAGREARVLAGRVEAACA